MDTLDLEGTSSAPILNSKMENVKAQFVQMFILSVIYLPSTEAMLSCSCKCYYAVAVLFIMFTGSQTCIVHCVL